MEVQVKLEDGDPRDLPCRQAVVTAQSQSVFDQSSLDEMSRPQVALAPSNLAGPPMLWSSRDVRAWLEFCVKEYALRPVCVDKFDLNGKALLLLTRTDFIERAPHAGDILYNVFQRLIQQDGPGYLRSPIYLPTPPHFIPPGAEILTRPLPAQNSRSVYIPIRPQPQTPICGSSHSSNTNSATCSASSSIVLSVDEENNSIGPGVPGLPLTASMLSPALSDKCSSEADSANNESGHSLHGSDHEMDYEESMNFDPGRDQNDDGVCRLLWEFIYQLLQDNKWSELVSWESVDDLTFRIQNPTNLADAWGKQKNRSNMTYEKLSRALRYYYKMNIIKKVQGKRLTYKFLQHPATIRKGQRGARPHSSKGLAPRESEAEPSSTEAITPDSSTFLPYCSASTASSSITAPPSSHDYSGHLASSKHEYISNKPLDSTTAGYDSKDTHFLSSSPDVKSSNHIQSSFILQETTSLGPSETTQSTSRPQSVSPGKHLLAMQKCQDRFCSVNEKRESSNHKAECRSQVTLLNISPEINRSHWTLPRTEGNSKTIPNVSLISEPLRAGCSPMLLCPEEKPHFFAFSERNISRQQSDQELAKDKAGYFSPSGSQLYVPYSMRHTAPSQFSSTKNHDETVQSFLYSNDSFHRHHQFPNSYPGSFNHTSAHSPYAHEQPRPYPASPDSYKRLQHNQHKDHIAANFSNPAAVPAHCAQDPFHIKRTLKQESYDAEQEEPEDLSMKQTLGQNGLRKKVKSESDIPLVSNNKDVNRDSPRSCSADSAYGSDRAEFGKDVSTDEFQV